MPEIWRLESRHTMYSSVSAFHFKLSTYMKKNQLDYYINKYKPLMPVVGEKFKNTEWTLLDDKLYHGKSGGVKVRVKCICGKEKIRSIAPLVHKQSPVKWCGECHRKYRTINPDPQWVGTKGIPSSYYRRTKEGARQRNLPFELTNEDMYTIYLQQSGTCALSGVPISFTTTTTNASLDRIDSSKGYTTNNVQWVHKDINRAKSIFNQDYFIGMCNSISSKNPITNNPNIFEQMGMSAAKEKP